MNMTQKNYSIEEARQFLEITPVRERDVPEWFKRALIRVYGRNPHSTTGLAVFWHAQDQCGWRWPDHWGSTVDDYGRSAFVSEPYVLSSKDLADIAEMCRRTNLRFTLSGESWHYPGSTLRVLIYE